jgi:hypothetical protein
MFSLATGIYQSYFAPPKLSILLIGIEGSGKTALLERIKVTGISSSRLPDVVPSDDDDEFAPYWTPRGAGAAVAVAGCRDDEEEILRHRDDDDDNDDDGGPAKRRDGSRRRPRDRRRPPSRRGGGGNPARLPPPLPPRLASRGRLRVKEMMVGGFEDCGGGWDAQAQPGSDGGGDGGDDDVRRALLRCVSPPPLFGGDDVDAASADVRLPSSSSSSLRTKGGIPILTPRSDRKSVLLPDIAEMSPGFNSVTIMSTPRPAIPAPAAGRPAVPPAKLNGLVGLLSRCPSPSRYANAALLGREEREEECDGEGIDVAGDDAVPSDGGTWNADYLNGYAIDYHEDEEFDNVGGGGRHHRRGGEGRQSARRMLPLDRIRPTLGQNLAKLALCGCECSLFDLSGAVSFSSRYRFVSSLGSVSLGPAVSFDRVFFVRWVGYRVNPSFRIDSGCFALRVDDFFSSSRRSVLIPPAP